MNDLRKVDGDYEFEVVGGKSIPTKAKELHEHARVFGGKGELEKAVDLLKQASRLAPDWAYPLYDLAYTYLLKGQSNEALGAYERVNKMEPKGFFTAKTASWALQREKEGLFPPGTYLLFLKIEWTNEDEEKLKRAQKIVEVVPNYPPALKECALRTKDPKQKMELISQALSANPDPETYGILMVNKAALLDREGKRDEAVRILGDLVLAPDSTILTVASAKSVLRLIVQKK
jgi:tetratricopeptide (TPR) repeat protein